MCRRRAFRKSQIRALGAALGVSLFLAHAPAAYGGEIDALLFGSLDAGAATFLTVGAKLGFGPLDQDGFVILTSVGSGRQRERGDGGLPRTRYTFSAATVLGYQWFFDWGTAAIFSGPEGAMEVLADQRALAALPAAYGLRLHGEIWARPTENTFLQATAIAGSTRDSLWTRLAWGYRAWGAYLGPEVSVYGDATGYRKWNLGLHGTDFAVARYNFRVSAGLQTESGRRSASLYVALAVWSPW
ncbi:cellulose biosynthesis protein BcsS [Methylobacterium sp. J-077]|uniref:cellulose biosynthesis protein BcsS n=1 Tax=Methylobacterium sp. J-077 TaxID=2836656 RepID=UPI001FB8E275|nr:cellulose biosynthesis protein BcsS [Methylobacterium sp. J-077]MCJ2124425.1 cellulose biosynthesis protein BcsS [Methylobacterium sp. J-077]